MPDPLDIILRIRLLTVDDAKRELAAVLHAEEQARVAADAAEALIASEAEVAADLCTDDDAVEGFAAWLPLGQANAANLRATHEHTRSELSRARAALTVARAEAEAAQKLIVGRARQRATRAARQSQAALDEIGLISKTQV